MLSISYYSLQDVVVLDSYNDFFHLYSDGGNSLCFKFLFSCCFPFMNSGIFNVTFLKPLQCRNQLRLIMYPTAFSTCLKVLVVKLETLFLEQMFPRNRKSERKSSIAISPRFLEKKG